MAGCAIPIYSGWFLIVFARAADDDDAARVRGRRAASTCSIAIPFEERSLRRSSRGAYDQVHARGPVEAGAQPVLRDAA